MPVSPKALFFDVFGTLMDWRNSIARELKAVLEPLGYSLDWIAFADAWRGQYQPAMEEVRSGRLPFSKLDVLHRRNLEAILPRFNVPMLPEETMQHLNLAWHRLDAWPDVPPGMKQLRPQVLLAPCSNGNIALMADLARRNAEANGLAQAARFVDGDVTWPSSGFDALGLAPSSFDHVLANPPFLTSGKARLPADPMLRRAHAADPAEMEGWLRFLSAFAKPKGTVTLIHRADALPHLLPLMERRFGRLILFPLFPRIGEPAVRMIIHGIKGSRASLLIQRGMVLHRADGGFMPEAESILRGGARLELMPAKTHFPE